MHTYIFTYFHTYVTDITVYKNWTKVKTQSITLDIFQFWQKLCSSSSRSHAPVIHKSRDFIKVAEHSFQEPMPNSP